MRPVAAAQGGKWAEPRDIRKAMARGDGLDVGGQGATLRVWRGHLCGCQGAGVRAGLGSSGKTFSFKRVESEGASAREAGAALGHTLDPGRGGGRGKD